MSGKNILWLTERYPPLAGGMSNSCERQVQELRKRGYNVDVCLLIYGEENKVKKYQRDNGYDLQIFYSDSTGNGAQLAWAEIQLLQAKCKYDLVFGFGINNPGYIATTFAKWLGVPSVISARGNDFDRDLFDAKRAFIVQQAMQQADYICAVTREKVNKIKSMYPEKKVFYSPNGIDSSLWEIYTGGKEKSQSLYDELSANGQRRVIGIFGELKFKKRIPMWLEAMRDNGLMDKVSLLIVGKVDAQLHQITHDESLTPHVMHMSFKTVEELPALYHACDYIVMPSLCEGFPNVLIEAMACGCIPIVSNAGAMEDIVRDGETGFLFQVEDRQEAGNSSIQALSLSDTELSDMKKAVKAVVSKEFTIDKEIEILTGWLDKVMA